MAQQISYNDIKNSCDNLRTLAKNFESTIQNLNEIIGRIKNPAWSGIASEAFVNKATSFCSNLESGKETIATAALFLAGCADGYQTIDEKAKQQLIDLLGGQDKINKIDVSALPEPNLNERVTSQFVNEVPVEEQSPIAQALISTGAYVATSRPSTEQKPETISDIPVYQAIPGDGGTETPQIPSDGTVPDPTLVLQKSVTIPDSIKQTGYTVTCYGIGGWYLGGGSTPSPISKGSRQEKVHDMWIKDGARYKNGIAVINVNGIDRYLVATSKMFGVCGDIVDIKLANGQIIPAILGDEKGEKTDTYGHERSDGSVNVLEFEVDRNVFNSLGNPKTDKWGLEWESSQPVTQIDNYGTILS